MIFLKNFFLVSLLILLSLLVLTSCDQRTTKPPETISTPFKPSGFGAAGTGDTNQTLHYSTGFSSSNFGHTLQYRFDWDDGDFSTWFLGTARDSRPTFHSWSNSGTYSVRAQARCATHTSIISKWSSAKEVTIIDPP